ncbi:peroxiredoxin-like family protein [Thalassotalea marina]|uniref:thioredoxin-dependent peroxiredoxin n=1 Tax=Thalassotalea marina TaxID=1673741 RepID=A0A919EIR3_9GAMM|nr:peroxiredoxin-like family protein [Thalassotalea marina]GHF88445.1 alkyl hydroperoxide reductase [Thalassotalea marina]
MKKIISLTLLVLSFVTQAKDIAEHAEAVSPLLNGQMVPDTLITTSTGQQGKFSELIKGKKSIVFFYRGGWCPFCNTQLGQLKEIEPKLVAMGYQLVGISTDSVDMLKDSTKSMKLDYQLFSDFDSKLSQAFGLAFFTSAKTTERYLAGMNLQNPLQKNAAGEERLVLPAPAVYLVDETGRVQFNYVNPNFRVRLSSELLLAAAKVYQD